MPHSLSEWQILERSTYSVAVALGIAPDAQETGIEWGGKDWVFRSWNPLSEGLRRTLQLLASCGVLEAGNEGFQYRWNFNYSWPSGGAPSSRGQFLQSRTLKNSLSEWTELNLAACHIAEALGVAPDPEDDANLREREEWKSFLGSPLCTGLWYVLEMLGRCGILELDRAGSLYRWNADFDWKEYGVEKVEKVSFRSQTLRHCLRDWRDPDVSPYYVAVALGVAPDPGEEWDFWGGHKWMFWSTNPLGEGLFGVVVRLIECGVLEEQEDYVTRWNRSYSWDEYEREIPEERLQQSQTLRHSLSYWRDVNTSAYCVAIALGVAPDSGDVQYLWGGKQSVFCTATPLGDCLRDCLRMLAGCGILEFEAENSRYRWNADFSWRDYGERNG